MAIDLSAICFNLDLINIDIQNDFIANVPPELNNRQALFDALRRELQLPDYFGNNWDAVSECLKDFSWVQRRRVIIMHKDVPSLGANDTRIYLDVLCECVCDWRRDENHELLIVFPKECSGIVANIASERPH